ncbi:UNVERIFIED_CONTAM: hypothetical protein Sindi_1712800 [Sesamum indicum]
MLRLGGSTNRSTTLGVPAQAKLERTLLQWGQVCSYNDLQRLNVDGCLYILLLVNGVVEGLHGNSRLQLNFQQTTPIYTCHFSTGPTVLDLNDGLGLIKQKNFRSRTCKQHISTLMLKEDVPFSGDFACYLYLREKGKKTADKARFHLISSLISTFFIGRGLLLREEPYSASIPSRSRSPEPWGRLPSPGLGLEGRPLI